MKRKYYKVVITLAVLFSTTCSGAVIYVDDDAIGNNDGSSWIDAFVYLQDALAIAQAGDEIWVAEGMYEPDQGGGNVLGDREATFQLISGVGLYGGFAGNESSLDERDWEAHQSVLSGDLNGDDVERTSPGELLNDPRRSDNSYHVIKALNVDDMTMLNGFSVVGGNANGSEPDDDGGGMYKDTDEMAVVNCTFTRNSAGDRGGAICNYESRSLISDCIFGGNFAWNGGGMFNRGSYANARMTVSNSIFSGNKAEHGGAMWDSTFCTTSIKDSIFAGNSAIREGGAVYQAYLTYPTYTNCIFANNTAGVDGGALLVYHSAATFTNCIFSRNIAGRKGGVMNIGIYTYAWITNCTFANNYAPQGTTLICDWSARSPNVLRLSNCILSNGGDEIINNDGSTIEVTYSNVQGGYTGDGNIDADPMFVGLIGWEYPEPVFINGRWVPQEPFPIFDYHLTHGSPCIDTGDPEYVTEPGETDLDGNPRIVNGRIDMGVYEGIANDSPISNPGQDQNYPILFEAYLNGENSYDPDEDYPLTYLWQIVEKPEGSVAELSGYESVDPTFTPDLVGEYRIELVVTDSKGLPSEPNYVTITAIPIEDEVENTLEETIDVINNLPDYVFKNPNSANALINKLNATLATLSEENYQDVVNKLQNDLLKKTDGCANEGESDKNDWIITCEGQERIYSLIIRAIELVEKLLE